MKRYILICVCALTVVASITDSIYACCVDPVACFEFTPSDAKCVGTTITFDATDSYDPDGTIIIFNWDFGDGESGTGAIVTHSYDEGGEFTVTLIVTDNDDPECCGGDPNCEDKVDEDSQTVDVLEVDLAKLPAGNSPDLPPSKICLNAQLCYIKAKWKAIVKGGGTAHVTSTGTVAVTFQGINGSNPASLSNNDEFWAIGDLGLGPGSYAITITHNTQPLCEDSDTDDIFIFEYDWTKTNESGAIVNDGTKDEVAGSVSAPKDTNPGDSTNAAEVYWYYDLKIVTNPAGAYGGNVQAKAEVTLDTDGTMEIKTMLRDDDPLTVSVSASLGDFINVSCSSSAGSLPFGGCVAGADCQIKIDTLPGECAGDVKKEHMDVPPSKWFVKTKEWPTAPDMSMSRSDITRTWAVGSTVIEFWVRVGVASNAKKPTGLNGSRVLTNEQQIGNVEVEEDDFFEIVP